VERGQNGAGISVELPEFRYGKALRSSSAGLLSSIKSEAAGWGRAEKEELLVAFDEFMESKLKGQKLMELDVQKVSVEIRSWIQENQSIRKQIVGEVAFPFAKAE